MGEEIILSLPREILFRNQKELLIFLGQMIFSFISYIRHGRLLLFFFFFLVCVCVNMCIYTFVSMHVKIRIQHQVSSLISLHRLSSKPEVHWLPRLARGCVLGIHLLYLHPKLWSQRHPQLCPDCFLGAGECKLKISAMCIN